jgi:uncharacterized protein YeaO (DUF488 family)
MFKLKRAYDEPERGDGARYLIDRLWPRGVKKDALKIEGWVKDVAPSDALRKWFKHDPAKWDEFRRRYFAELDTKRDAWEPLLEAGQKGPVTLVYSAHDAEHNNAVALAEYLSKHGKPHRRNNE